MQFPFGAQGSPQGPDCLHLSVFAAGFPRGEHSGLSSVSGLLPTVVLGTLCGQPLWEAPVHSSRGSQLPPAAFAPFLGRLAAPLPSPLRALPPHPPRRKGTQEGQGAALRRPLR